ncbi:hypothetical protein [Deinococcus roseus]|uniref:Uncharacterized protein n=1 Tax=Deinococcus roseus TaxID=392414 RepID=A0ABQ2DEG5_9DEIO|nr:hypothetical protein [Deinococcus roseus]GGJ55225.1 hypothetical protein GCM10008938_46710 [Deinococcus roseus]
MSADPDENHPNNTRAAGEQENLDRPFDLHRELARLAELPRENPEFVPMSPEERQKAHENILQRLSFLKQPRSD